MDLGEVIFTGAMVQSLLEAGSGFVEIIESLMPIVIDKRLLKFPYYDPEYDYML